MEESSILFSNTLLMGISMVIFLSFLLWIKRRYGILPSVSDSYYYLPKNKQWIFTISLWTFSLPLSIVGSTGLIFFAVTGICFVGAAAAYKDKMTSTVHVIGAIVGIGFGFLSLLFDFHLYWLALSGVLLMIMIKLLKINNHTYWIEIVGYITVFLGIYYQRIILDGTILEFIQK